MTDKYEIDAVMVDDLTVQSLKYHINCIDKKDEKKLYKAFERVLKYYGVDYESGCDENTGQDQES